MSASYGFDDAVCARVGASLRFAPGLCRLTEPRSLSVTTLTERDASWLTSTLSAAGSMAAVSFPIIYDSEMYGWITVDVTDHPERLDDNADIAERLRGLAGQAAIAIRNARLLDEIRHQALHDSLTGLPNRVLILDRVTQTLARARREHFDVAVLFIDLDGFKDINDTLGHGIGDILLKAVAARFAGTLRESDTVARLGGDEFVVVAEGLSLAAGPELVAERLLDVLAEPFHLDDDKTSVTISASIGIAVGLRDSAEELLRDADIALYAAKDGGKNCFVVFAGRDADRPAQPPRARDGPPGGHRHRPVLLVVPTDLRPCGHVRRRRRSALALAPPDPGTAPARRVHPRLRDLGPDHPRRSLGPSRGLPPGHEMAGQGPGHQDVGQCLGAPVRRRLFARRRRAGAGALGAPRRRPDHRDHRDEPHAQHQSWPKNS